MNTQTETKLIDKIRKLLALATSPNEAEAMAAMAKAVELANEYQLDIERIRVQSGDNSAVEMENKATHGQLQAWMKIALGGLCRGNACKLILGGKTYYILGAKTDVAIVEQMWVSVQAQIRHLAERGWESDGKHEWPADQRRKWTNCYKEGVAQRVCTRLKEARDAANMQASDSTALVLRRDTRVAEYVKEQFGKLGKSRFIGSTASASARDAGYRDGANVRLAKEVAGRKALPG